MDLKTSYVSVQTDFGSMNGRVLDLVMFLRKAAFSDLSRMIEQELIHSEPSYVSTVNDSDINDELIGDGYDEEVIVDGEQEVLDTEPTVEEPEPSTIENEFDTEISSKISKYAEVIGYYDNIIAANGEVPTITNPVDTYINKFNELDGIFQTYDYFDVFTPAT